MLVLTNNNITAKGAASLAKGVVLALDALAGPPPLPHVILVWD